jgi:hypothetical protein
MRTDPNNRLLAYKCPEAEVILIEHTDFILYDLPPVDDEGEDEW